MKRGPAHPGSASGQGPWLRPGSRLPCHQTAPGRAAAARNDAVPDGGQRAAARAGAGAEVEVETAFFNRWSAGAAHQTRAAVATHMESLESKPMAEC